jgi:hypothetical protein
MCAKMAFQHQAGTAMECLSVRNTFFVLLHGRNFSKNMDIVYDSFTYLSINKYISGVLSFLDLIGDYFQIPITLHKEVDGDTMRCGFKIGGGIDQDFHKSPQGYTDNVRMYTILPIK